jgi:hypothetical protein
MGLQSPINLHGLSNEAGYWRLAGFSWSINEPLTARMTINGYASKNAFDEGLPPLVSKELSTEMTSEDGQVDLVKVEMLVRVRGLAYMEIKRFPEFNEAIDV